MSDHSLRARSVAELVDAAFSLYRRDASSYIMVTAIASVPGLVAQLILLGGLNDLSFLAGMSALVVFVVSMVTYALMTGVVMKVGSTVYLGGTADVDGAVRAVLPKVGSLISAAILRIPLYFLGLLAAGVGVFYVFARWFAVEAVIVLEERSTAEAFGRSTQLSNGQKWHVFRTLLLGYGIYLLLAMGISIFGVAFQSELLNLILSTAFTIVAFPIIGLLTMLLFYDLRIRKEGFDVEHLAASLGNIDDPAPFS